MQINNINNYQMMAVTPAIEQKSSGKLELSGKNSLLQANEAQMQKLTQSQTQTQAKSNAISFSNFPVNSRKEAAKQNIAWLKMQLEGLLKFVGISGNPQAAIQLAKQLAAAVREYGASGGDVAMPQTQLALPTVTAAAGVDTSGAESPTAIATATDGGNESAAAPDTPPAQSEPTTEMAQAAAVAALAAQQTQASGSSEKTPGSETGIAPSTEAQSLTTTMHNTSSGMSAQDRAFFADVKNLMNRIKMLIQMETKKAEDEKKAKAAIQEMDKAFNSATAGVMQENTTQAYDASGISITESIATTSISVNA
jgi:hypothetical protein